MTRIIALLFSTFLALPLHAADLTIYAAASLRTALDEAVPLYEADSGDTVTLSYAGSSALARQIQQGAPSDVFISANVGWMDTLDEADLLVADSRRDLLGNSLVLISAEPGAPLTINAKLDFSALLGQGKLAMALVDAVPAGIYGKAALESLGQWRAVAPQVAQADNVRAALALVALGAAPYGIVYATDAKADPRVTVRGTFPEDSHAPIIYPAAALEGSGPEALAFLNFLQGPMATEIFVRNGFTSLGE